MVTTYAVTRQIQAPIALVFERISDVRRFKDVNEDVLEIEFLTDQQTGVGTRFKETRSMNGRRSCTTLELTELVDNGHVRFVSDEGGAIWDTVMRVEAKDGGTQLSMTMDARPHKFLARLTMPLIKGMVTKALVADMDKLKTWCEREAAARAD